MKFVFSIVLLVISNSIFAEKPQIELRTYEYGNTKINEFRERGGVNRVEVRPGTGPGYTVQDNKIPTLSDGDYVGKNAYISTFEIKSW